MFEKKQQSMFLNKNVQIGKQIVEAWTEISVNHPMFGTLLREKHLVKSKALAENNPNAVANELDKATKRITDLEKILSEKNEEIVSLNERVEELEKDNTSLSKELEKATKKSKKNSENE